MSKYCSLDVTGASYDQKIVAEKKRFAIVENVTKNEVWTRLV